MVEGEGREVRVSGDPGGLESGDERGEGSEVMGSVLRGI